MTDLAIAAVLTRRDVCWDPSPYSAGLLTAMAELPEAGAGEPAILNAQLLRAPKLAALSIEARLIRSGRRDRSNLAAGSASAESRPGTTSAGTTPAPRCAILTRPWRAASKPAFSLWRRARDEHDQCRLLF